MAQNVKFIKGNTATLAGVSIVDGQILYNTVTGQHYEDVGTTRIEVGKVVDTVLSDSSTNAIANSTVKAGLDSKAGIELTQVTDLISSPITGFSNGSGKSITLSASFSSYKKLRFVFINTGSSPRSTYAEVNVSDLLLTESGTYGAVYVAAAGGTCGFENINSTSKTMLVVLLSSQLGSTFTLAHVYGINIL